MKKILENKMKNFLYILMLGIIVILSIIGIIWCINNLPNNLKIDNSSLDNIRLRVLSSDPTVQDVSVHYCVIASGFSEKKCEKFLEDYKEGLSNPKCLREIAFSDEKLRAGEDYLDNKKDMLNKLKSKIPNTYGNENIIIKKQFEQEINNILKNATSIDKAWINIKLPDSLDLCAEDKLSRRDMIDILDKWQTLYAEHPKDNDIAYNYKLITALLNERLGNR